jgi:ATP-dependent DNA helicase DinG
MLLAWLYCLITALHFRHTDISTVGERVRQCLDEGQRFSRMLMEVSAGSGCTPSHTHCPAQVVTVQAQAADLVITNHHKLALLDRDPVLADCFTNYIVDEANHFEPAVRNAFGQAVHAREIQAVLDYLERRVRDALGKRPAKDEALLSRTLDDIRSLRAAAADFRQILLAIRPKAVFGAVQTLPYSHPVFADGAMRLRIEGLHAAVESVVRGLKWLKEDDPHRTLTFPSRTRRRMAQHLEQLEEAAATLGSIHDAIVYENNITVYQIFRKHWTFGTLMVQVADLIREQIYDRKKCVVFTAATLCHRNRFDSFQAITGMAPSPTIENAISPREFRFARISSPFPRDAMEIIVPQDAVSGKYDNKNAWIDAVARALPRLIRRNRGRTLVLFSSYQDLHQILEKAGADLDDPRYPLLVQRPGQATSRLCEEFRAVKESVLLGVDTFWYGVDFKGDTLTQVVITRIPYPPPGDPVQMGRKHTLPPGEFWERYRYDTDIKMKQGIGRLIRCETDRGRVVVLDARYRPSL